MTLTATNEALDLFETSKFDNSNEITATLNELNQAERNEQDPAKQLQITKKKNCLLVYMKQEQNKLKLIHINILKHSFLKMFSQDRKRQHQEIYSMHRLKQVCHLLTEGLYPLQQKITFKNI